MALPATDAFTAANGTALTTYSANWTLNSGNYAIQSNAVAGSASSTRLMAHWNADAFDADQYVEGTITALSQTGRWIGVAARVAASGHTGIEFVIDGGLDWFLTQWVNGSATVLDSGTLGASPVGQVMRLEVEGTDVRALFDGVQVGSGTTSIASGSAGLGGYSQSTLNLLDDWEGGNLGGGAGGAATIVPGARQKLEVGHSGHVAARLDGYLH